MPRERKNALKNKNNNTDGNEQDSVPTKTTKKRRSSNATSQANSTNNSNNNSNTTNNNNTNSASHELIPPQPNSTYGDTLIASNPFDDTPTQTSQSTPNSTTPTQQQPSTPSLPSNPSTPLPTGMQPTQQQTQPPQSQPPGQQPKPVPLMSGKIYPPEQSMVFNPTNPNAPPIYPCGICHKEVHDNDHAILCESGCNFWFHRICTGLGEKAYLLLKNEIYAEWVCDKCLNAKKIPLVKYKP